MTEYEKLKRKLTKKTIAEIENLCDKKSLLSAEYRKEFILSLHYLQSSGKYMDNPQFKKATFGTYLWQRYNLRDGAYNKEKWAYLRYPEESVKIGVGCVTKVREKCGVTKAPKVIEEIMRLDKRTHNNIENVIEKNAHATKPKPKPKPKKNTPSDQAEVLNAETRETITAYEKQITEYEEQIKKLKISVANRDATIKSMQITIDRQREEIDTKQAFINSVLNAHKKYNEQHRYAH